MRPRPPDARPRTRSRRRLRCGIHEDGLADARLAGHEQCSAVGPGRGEERADALRLRLAPDELAGLVAVALLLVMPPRVDVVQRRAVPGDPRVREVYARHVTGRERSAPPEIESFDA